LDHKAVSWIGSFIGPQVGDNILVDLGEPSRIKSYLMYSVWADFPPEDALIKGRPANLRGNLAIIVSPDVEETIRRALEEFKSQKKIIEELIRHREERFINCGYLEVYLKYDPRPRMSILPYIEAIHSIDKEIAENKTSELIRKLFRSSFP
jgi:hypothetical protein